ncbi:MAG TPA: hypothetical protein VK181_02660 [Rhizobium sp.]|nr:hypothetical protein [Rhizobium sp.]
MSFVGGLQCNNHPEAATIASLVLPENRDGGVKEGPLKPIPSPVLVRRYSGEGDWHDTCAGILGLTKMDWNNNTLYKKLPVTLGYSKAFADIIQQNPAMVDEVYDFRNFM